MRIRFKTVMDQMNSEKPDDVLSDLETKMRYKELIMAVASKYEGESRHETALRYIIEREKAAIGTEQTGFVKTS